MALWNLQRYQASHRHHRASYRWSSPVDPENFLCGANPNSKHIFQYFNIYGLFQSRPLESEQGMSKAYWRGSAAGEREHRRGERESCDFCKFATRRPMHPTANHQTARPTEESRDWLSCNSQPLLSEGRPGDQCAPQPTTRQQGTLRKPSPMPRPLRPPAPTQTCRSTILTPAAIT